MNKMKLLLTLAIPVLLFQDAQAQSSRLTATAHWTHNGAEFKRTDSTYYNYLSTVRGGDLNSVLKFDDGTKWVFWGDTLNNNMRWVQEFDASNNLVSKVEQMWDTAAKSWVNTNKNIYTYNTSNKKTSTINQMWNGGAAAWETFSKNAYTYNAAGKLDMDDSSTWDGSTYTPVKQKQYFYDAAGNMINETWRDIVGGSPVNTNRVNYTFTTTNKLKTTTNGVWNGLSWDDVDMYDNTYDSASGRRTSQLYAVYNGTVFVNNMLRLYSNFAGNNPMTEIAQTWDTAGAGSWNDMNKYAYTYNSNGKLTSATSQTYDVSVPGWVYTSVDTKTNYYYGAFVSVKNVSNNGGTANLFPVPASSTLNISLNWNQAQAATVTVVDMAGRVIKTQNVASSQNKVSISVADLTDGVYMVNITGAEGQIVKQITVAH